MSVTVIIPIIIGVIMSTDRTEICLELIIILTIISKCEINSGFPEMYVICVRKSFDKREMSIFDIPQT